MTDAPSFWSADRWFALVWAGAAVFLASMVIWGAIQQEDPLANYIPTDTMRHILAFGAIGTCAAFMPSPRLRIAALFGVLGFAVLVEAIQIPIPNRNASVRDLFNSTTGTFGGFGLGAAATMMLYLMRDGVRIKS